MTDKAYIVVNKQQEHEVLEKLEREGVTWIIGRKPTEQMPSTSSFVEFPYVLFSRNRLSWGFIESLSDEEIVYDGRKEEQMSEKYVVSQEFMNELKKWEMDLMTYGKHGYFVGYMDIGGLPAHVYDWLGENISNKENNNRLIAILRWVNGEDVFEVESKKWVVRSKESDIDNDYTYVYVTNSGLQEASYNKSIATKFDTKEEAESWANSHQELIEVVDV